MFPAGPRPPASASSVPRRTPTARVAWQCSRRTSTARVAWQRSPPDLNRELRPAVFPAGPQTPAPDRSGHRRTSPNRMTRMSECVPNRMSECTPDRMAEYLPSRMPNRTPAMMRDKMQEVMVDDVDDRMSAILQDRTQSICQTEHRVNLHRWPFRVRITRSIID